MPDSSSGTPTAPAWTAGAAYEPFIGRWSQLVAREFLAWLDVSPGAIWLDVGCGTGALTRTILESANPRSVTGVDPSPAFLDFARAHTTNARVRFAAGDARALPVPDTTADAAVSGLVLNFVPESDQPQAAAEMVRATRPGGIVAAYLWDSADGMEILSRFWSAAASLDPVSRKLAEANLFRLNNLEALTDLFRQAGIEKLEPRAIDVTAQFRDFDDYWLPFLGGQGPAPGYLNNLEPDQRAMLRDRLESSLPTAADGSIRLLARAWAVKGVAPPR